MRTRHIGVNEINNDITVAVRGQMARAAVFYKNIDKQNYIQDDLKLCQIIITIYFSFVSHINEIDRHLYTKRIMYRNCFTIICH